MKRVLSVILAAALLALLPAACKAEKSKEKSEASASEAATTQAAATEAPAEDSGGTHPLYFKDSTKSEKAVATFFNSLSGESTDVEMVKTGEDDSGVTFRCEGDCSAYNMVYVTCGDKKSKRFAFNKCVSGWYQTEPELMPYIEGGSVDPNPKYDDITLPYGEDEKTVHIWKPADYDPASAEAYDTIYVLDAQSLVISWAESIENKDCPIITDVQAMTAVTGRKAIVVVVETLRRNYELVPKIADFSPERTGENEFEAPEGEQLSAFFVNTLVPYVRSNYNVSTEAVHTSVLGASLSGITSFYLALENPTVFGTAGAMSPSFPIYESAGLDAYIAQKTFDSSAPLMYFYTGPAEFDTEPFVTEMAQRLKSNGYPADKIVLHYDSDGAHGGFFWRGTYSEFLTAMVFRQVKPLQG